MTVDTPVVAAFRAATSALAKSFPRHAAVGGLARNAWGTPRATTDVDFAVVMEPGMFEDLLVKLNEAGFVTDRIFGPAAAEDPLPDVVFLRAGSLEGVRLDLLVAKTPFEIQAVENAHETKVLGSVCRVITPEDLIIYKLIAFRPRDRLDIEDVIAVQRRVRPIDVGHIDRWAAEWGVAERWAPLRETAREEPPLTG